jgi:hypothetical protein
MYICDRPAQSPGFRMRRGLPTEAALRALFYVPSGTSNQPIGERLQSLACKQLAISSPDWATLRLKLKRQIAWLLATEVAAFRSVHVHDGRPVFASLPACESRKRRCWVLVWMHPSKVVLSNKIGNTASTLATRSFFNKRHFRKDADTRKIGAYGPPSIF